MHVTCIKIIETQQPTIYNSYKNTRLNLLKTNVAILFNKICKTKQMTPKQLSIKINRNKCEIC